MSIESIRIDHIDHPPSPHNEASYYCPKPDLVHLELGIVCGVEASQRILEHVTQAKAMCRAPSLMEIGLIIAEDARKRADQFFAYAAVRAITKSEMGGGR